MVPGVPAILNRKGRRRGGATSSPEYCYRVWLKHLVIGHEAGLPAVPGTVGELGPGATLGVGVCALLSGVNRYCALDVVRYGDAEDNVKILDDLIELFQKREPVPESGWPKFGPFPGHILSEDRLRDSLRKERVDAIRQAIKNPGKEFDGISLSYFAPWNDENLIEHDSVDLLMSHSTLEHVDDLESTYSSMAKWVKQGGWMTHQIDLTSHGITPEWDGYRMYSDRIWRIVRGNRLYFINRAPHGEHRDLLSRNGFRIKTDMPRRIGSKLPGNRLAEQWKTLSDEDLNSCGSFFVVQR